jgi:hypothetical protein
MFLELGITGVVANRANWKGSALLRGKECTDTKKHTKLNKKTILHMA